MNRIAVAKELVAIAKELTATDELQMEIAELTDELNVVKNELAIGGMPPFFKHQLEEKVKGIRNQTKALLRTISNQREAIESERISQGY